MAKIPFTIEAWLKDKSQKVFDNKGNELVICSFEFTSNEPYIHAYEKKNDCGRKGYKLDEVFFRSEPELTDWQRLISGCLQKHGLLDCGAADKIAQECSAELLSFAREQLIKDGYVIEKKAFHDAVENVEPETNVLINMTIDYALHAKKDGDRHAEMDCEEFKRLFHKYYDRGKEDALKKIEQDPESSYAFKRGVEYGKEEALKHLPRWRKASSGTKLPAESVIRSKGSDPRYGIVAVNDCEYITINDLNRLPKEDKK